MIQQLLDRCGENWSLQESNLLIVRQWRTANNACVPSHTLFISGLTGKHPNREMCIATNPGCKIRWGWDSIRRPETEMAAGQESERDNMLTLFTSILTTALLALSSDSIVLSGVVVDAAEGGRSPGIQRVTD